MTQWCSLPRNAWLAFFYCSTLGRLGHPIIKNLLISICIDLHFLYNKLDEILKNVDARLLYVVQHLSEMICRRFFQNVPLLWIGPFVTCSFNISVWLQILKHWIKALIEAWFTFMHYSVNSASLVVCLYWKVPGWRK